MNEILLTGLACMVDILSLIVLLKVTALDLCVWSRNSGVWTTSSLVITEEKKKMGKNKITLIIN